MTHPSERGRQDSWNQHVGPTTLRAPGAEDTPSPKAGDDCPHAWIPGTFQTPDVTHLRGQSSRPPPTRGRDRAPAGPWRPATGWVTPPTGAPGCHGRGWAQTELPTGHQGQLFQSNLGRPHYTIGGHRGHPAACPHGPSSPTRRAAGESTWEDRAGRPWACGQAPPAFAWLGQTAVSLGRPQRHTKRGRHKTQSGCRPPGPLHGRRQGPGPGREHRLSVPATGPVWPQSPM